MTDAPKSNQVEPTKGPWTYEATGSQPGAFSIVGDAPQMVALVYGETRDAQRKNARLIAEAGTVYSESGLSPRALLEQRDAAQAELRETLRHVLHHCGPSLTHTIVTAVLSARSAEPPQDLHKVEREDDGWLPIESALRDGTRILWCSPKEPWAKLPHIYCVIHWPEYSDCFESGSWRPLPPPPAAARGE